MSDLAQPMPQETVPSGSKPRPAHTLDLLGFEMALDSLQPALNGFSQCVREAVAASGGTFLFDMPAAGLLQNAQKVAALDLAGKIIFVILSEDGTQVTVEPADESNADLTRLAEAVVALDRSFKAPEEA